MRLAIFSAQSEYRPQRKKPVNPGAFSGAAGKTAVVLRIKPLRVSPWRAFILAQNRISHVYPSLTVIPYLSPTSVDNLYVLQRPQIRTPHIVSDGHRAFTVRRWRTSGRVVRSSSPVSVCRCGRRSNTVLHGGWLPAGTLPHPAGYYRLSRQG